MSRSPSPQPAEPLPIRRLHEALINRIAAGEIIHRPASALKELLENALDAGATTIKVTVKDGGMKLLQIQDNGCGIRKHDLPLLATRFTTSKLQSFSDLSRLQTYGFRGEALASISHVAHLSVVTKTRQDNCAWKAHYSAGDLIPPKPGQSADPKPCAGNDGTTITVEDLFYATPTRLSALKSASDEYARILDVVSRYATHNPKVSFSLKKAGSSGADVSTPQGSTIQNVIGLLYGQSVAKELVKVDVSEMSSSLEEDGLGTLDQDRDKTMDVDSNASPIALKPKDDPSGRRWSAQAFVTSPNYQAKRFVFLLFINLAISHKKHIADRLVESSRIKRAVEAAYSGTLPKGASPFAYLSIVLPPEIVDVNVHPTKREVHFLDEEGITERIADEIQNSIILGSAAQSRSYTTQTLGAPQEVTQSKGKQRVADNNDEEREEDHAHATPTTEAKQKKILSQHKVRTSKQDRTLDSMFVPVSQGSKTQSRTSESVNDPPESSNSTRQPQPSTMKEVVIEESECYLTSIRKLRTAIQESKHDEMSEVIQDHVFVGVVDLDRCLSLIQQAKKLYLVNHSALAEELFYQLGLRQFGNFPRLKLNPPPSLRRLVSLAVNAETGLSNSGISRTQIIDKIVETLMSKKDLLQEYFAMTITSNGLVESLPLLLRRYTPNLDRLPLFLMRLGPQVEWSTEEECFDTFLRELAYFYVPGPLPDAPAELSADMSEEQRAKEKFQLQHVLFPSMRRYLTPPKMLLEKDIVQVASLPDLYRVFERC